MAATLAIGDGSYEGTRARLERYFDGTARKAWIDLTSDAPVSGVRATVRAGRERMRATLLGWLPEDLRGMRLLDAGCGTGALAVAAARRGAEVVAVDIAAGLVRIARERAPANLPVRWHVGDFADPALGRFDHVIAMDSLIHYRAADMVGTLAALAQRTRTLAFTFAPRTPLLAAMHAAGRLFPRGDRAPAIEPVSEARLRALLAGSLGGHRVARGARVASGFYTSHALMLAPA